MRSVMFLIARSKPCDYDILPVTQVSVLQTLLSALSFLALQQGLSIKWKTHSKGLLWFSTWSQSGSEAESRRDVWGTVSQWLPAVSASSRDAESSWWILKISGAWGINHGVMGLRLWATAAGLLTCWVSFGGIKCMLPLHSLPSSEQTSLMQISLGCL